MVSVAEKAQQDPHYKIRKNLLSNLLSYLSLVLNRGNSTVVIPIVTIRDSSNSWDADGWLVVLFLVNKLFRVKVDSFEFSRRNISELVNSVQGRSVHGVHLIDDGQVILAKTIKSFVCDLELP